MLAIRDDQVDNHFNDKFVPLCHVSYLINGDEWKLIVKYIALFILLRIKCYIFIFRRRIYQQITYSRTKVTIYPTGKFRNLIESDLKRYPIIFIWIFRFCIGELTWQLDPSLFSIFAVRTSLLQFSLSTHRGTNQSASPNRPEKSYRVIGWPRFGLHVKLGQHCFLLPNYLNPNKTPLSYSHPTSKLWSMRKKKDKIILPPELPLEIPDDEVEVSDDDLQFIKENCAYASLVSTLDTHSITKFASSLFYSVTPYLQCYILRKLLAKVILFLKV